MTLKPLTLSGTVEAVLIANTFGTHTSTPMDKIKLIQGQGVLHDLHYGPRLLDVRDSFALRFGLPKGMECFNMRQWSAVSREELQVIATEMGIASIDEGVLGENLIVSGIPNFTMLPPGTQFFFKDPQGKLRTTVLFVYGENLPCEIPGNAIQDRHPDKQKLKSAFIRHATGRRGLVGCVIGSGFIKKGDSIIAHVPQQRRYECVGDSSEHAS